MKRKVPKRHRISIRRRTDTKDGYGEAVPAWADLFSRIPARVRDDSQREYTNALQVQSDKTIHVEIRDPHQLITEKDQVVWHARDGDQVLDIKAALAGENDGSDLTLMCIKHS